MQDEFESFYRLVAAVKCEIQNEHILKNVIYVLLQSL